jgi:hypothetical protein
MNDPDFSSFPDEFDQFRIAHIREVISGSGYHGQLVTPVDTELDYQITLKEEAAPSGATVRCWMPYPRENHPRQTNIKLVAAYPAGYFTAPFETPQRTMYMEQAAAENESLRFQSIIRMRTYAQYYNLRTMNILPYNRETDLYRQYTNEQPPHILFSERIKELSKTIVDEAEAPDEIVRRIFYWIDRNIPWSGAIEYGLMESMPEYVLDNMRGDCGMVTLLFMTLARYNGIPVRWQSGWMLHPGEVNLHDWCEVFYEGVGWVPLDMSFGLMPSDDLQEREFYISGMDAYRYIVNDDIGAPLVPEKRFLRSEPWDFQRGELEWEGGNIYFDKWRYKMNVSYHNN